MYYPKNKLLHYRRYKPLYDDAVYNKDNSTQLILWQHKDRRENLPYGGDFYLRICKALYKGTFNSEEDLHDPKYYAYLIHFSMNSRAKNKYDSSYFKRLKRSLKKLFKQQTKEALVCIISVFKAVLGVEYSIKNDHNYLLTRNLLSGERREMFPSIINHITNKEPITYIL
jgi:hypothetical protein